MTKAVICTHCMDILAPYRDWQTNRGWRWCQCGHAASRWRDGARGLLEVTALHGPQYVRVLGLMNSFLEAAVAGRPWGEPESVHEEWRLLHDQACEDVPEHYLFNESKRQCWAVVIRPNETGDVTFVDYADAANDTTPGSSTDRSASS